jgi:hypothetical protein
MSWKNLAFYFTHIGISQCKICKMQRTGELGASGNKVLWKACYKHVCVWLQYGYSTICQNEGVSTYKPLG